MAHVRVKLKNPKILTWAREELGLTISEVGKRFKKDSAIIKAWENGDDAPTFHQLIELANYYKRPVAVFFLPSLPPKTPKPHDYRTLPRLARDEYLKETLVAYREVYNMLAETRELLDEIDSDIVFSLPTWEMNEDPDALPP